MGHEGNVDLWFQLMDFCIVCTEFDSGKIVGRSQSQAWNGHPPYDDDSQLYLAWLSTMLMLSLSTTIVPRWNNNNNNNNDNNNVHLSCAHQRPERSHETY